MKAINKNGKITIYQGVPQSFTSSQGVHLNAPNMSEEALKNAGLFDLIIDENYDFQNIKIVLPSNRASLVLRKTLIKKIVDPIATLIWGIQIKISSAPSLLS